jgi:hypothetical protein
MRQLFILLLLGFGNTLIAQTKISLIGKLTQSQSYCGGARPTQEIMDDINKPTPIANKTLYIKKGLTNNTKSKTVLKVKTDSLGHFHCKLAIGSYYIVGDNKINLSYYSTLLKKYSKASKNFKAIDQTCLKDWLKQPALQFKVKAVNNDTLKIHEVIPCEWNSIPCASYTGYLPS